MLHVSVVVMLCFLHHLPVPFTAPGRLSWPHFLLFLSQLKASTQKSWRDTRRGVVRVSKGSRVVVNERLIDRIEKRSLVWIECVLGFEIADKVALLLSYTGEDTCPIGRLRFLEWCGVIFLTRSSSLVLLYDWVRQKQKEQSKRKASWSDQ